MPRNSPKDPSNRYDFSTGVSMFDGRPFVVFTVNGKADHLPVAKAREIGLALVEAAIEAVRDAAVVDFMMEDSPRDQETMQDAARMLAAIREHRRKYEDANK